MLEPLIKSKRKRKKEEKKKKGCSVEVQAIAKALGASKELLNNGGQGCDLSDWAPIAA